MFGFKPFFRRTKIRSGQNLAVEAAYNAAGIATKFMEAQLLGFDIYDATGKDSIKIDADKYYSFAAGVYDCCAQRSELHHGYDKNLSIAAIPAFLSDDKEAAGMIWNKLTSGPSQYSNLGGNQCSMWLDGLDFDHFSLARILDSSKLP